MKIEVRNLKIAASLSEETTAFTADIYVDGIKTFAASNHGHGGCDMYHRLPTAKVTEAEVNAWLADHCPPDGPFNPAERTPWDNGHICNLETFVGRVVQRVDGERESTKIRRQYERKLATRICALNAKGEFVLFGKAVHTPTPDRLAQVRDRNPAYVFLNDADEATKEKGLRAYCPNFGTAAGPTDEQLQEAVYERLRSGTLTVADAKYLRAENDRAERPCPDTAAMLEQVIADGEAAYTAYCETRDAQLPVQVR